nr:adenylosuccinate synthetase [Pedobacter panaciterrae]
MVIKQAFVVVGLGYGDEGKGLTTDYLCTTNENPVVIRFNGGHQAGHCVVTESGQKHIFSNFGAGTLRNVPTFWSRFCTFSPTYFLEELAMLPLRPKFYIDLKSPVTTHYDILYNRTREISLGNKKNGSCGVGFGATIDRNKKGPKFSFEDLLEDQIVGEKLGEIASFYRPLINRHTKFDFDVFKHEEEDLIFRQTVKQLIKLIASGIVIPISERDFFSDRFNWSTYVFEGAQGIMLDKSFGKRPHITKSNTSSCNAMKIIQRQRLKVTTAIYYVTRAYQTRHGAGQFPVQDSSFHLINNEEETNVKNRFQGVFKTNYLNLDDLNSAIRFDIEFSKDHAKNLVITCLDQLPSENVSCFKNRELISLHYREIINQISCPFNKVFYSFSNCSKNLKT